MGDSATGAGSSPAGSSSNQEARGDKRGEGHERRVVGHASGWQEQMDTCVCGKPWPCPSAVSHAGQKYATPPFSEADRIRQQGPQVVSPPSTTARSGATPRTDAIALGVAMYSNDDVKLRDALAHGRELERELDAANRRAEARAREACTSETRATCSFAASTTPQKSDAAKREHWRQWAIDGMPADKMRLAEATWEAAASALSAIAPKTEAQILAAKVVVKKGEFADLFTASTAALLLATEILRIAHPDGVPSASKIGGGA